jgi:hypothetical protein
VIVYDRNADGTRGRLLFDTDDPAWVEHFEYQVELREIRARASDRLRAAALRLRAGRFGREGGAHRERRWRPRAARLLYRLISG